MDYDLWIMTSGSQGEGLEIKKFLQVLNRIMMKGSTYNQLTDMLFSRTAFADVSYWFLPLSAAKMEINLAESFKACYFCSPTLRMQ